MNTDFIYVHMHKYICIYIYVDYQHHFIKRERYLRMYIYMGNGISPPAFCDVSRSHELKQFKVKGLGYMSFF